MMKAFLAFLALTLLGILGTVFGAMVLVAKTFTDWRLKCEARRIVLGFNARRQGLAQEVYYLEKDGVCRFEVLHDSGSVHFVRKDAVLVWFVEYTADGSPILLRHNHCYC